MDPYDDGGASPDPYGGGGGGLVVGGSITVVCDCCGAADDYIPDDYSNEGFFTCRCGAVLTSTPIPEADLEGVWITGSRPPLRRVKQTPTPRIPARCPTTQQPPAAPAFSESDEPRDFVSGADPEELGARVRRRYVRSEERRVGKECLL